MKLVPKIILIFLLLFSTLLGYLCTYENNLYKSLYKITFYTENVKNNISNILLQKHNINNLGTTDTSNLMNEYFITFFNDIHLNNPNATNKIKRISESSNFSILNSTELNLNENLPEIYNHFSNKDNLLIIEKVPFYNNFKAINENLSRFFQYSDFSLAYSNPKLLTYEDLLKLYKYIITIKNSNYIPIIIFNKNNLNESLLENLSHTNACFLVLDDNFKIIKNKNIPVLHINSKELNCFFQFNLFISSNNLKKIRFKLFPLDENGNTPSKEILLNLLNEYNKSKELNFNLGENEEYIYFDHEI